MKKILSITLSILIIFQAFSAFAKGIETGNTQTKNTVKITLSLKSGYCHAFPSQAALDISDGVNTYTKIIDINDNTPTQDITFYVDEYLPGKAFSITPTLGIDKLIYNDISETSISVVPVFDGFSNQTPIYVEYIPAMHNAVDIVINSALIKFNVTARNIGEHIIVPMEEAAKALELTYSYQNGSYTVSSPYASIWVDSENNMYSESTTTTKIMHNSPVSPQTISGELFVPISLFAQAFNLKLLMQQSEDKPILYIATSKTEPVTEQKSDYVNSAGLSSQTDYLIWVSKSEYKVRVYMGKKGNWTLAKTFTCAIGAPSTPTCTGTYKYYQAQSKWDFKSYYVGPVMRFNGGYAMHSTLLRPDGTPLDNRVGVKISHGCVRLRPDDINWMFYYVPLYTTVHITN